MELRYQRPEDRPPAPSPLDRVQAFINTRINLRGTDDYREELASPAALRRWLTAHGLAAQHVRVDQDDLDRAIALREGLRGLLGRDRTEPLDALAEVAGVLPLRVSVTTSEPALVPFAPHGVEHALATLLADTVAAHFTGTLSRLKVCREPTCRGAFYDASKNRSGSWCAMGACGAEIKKRRFTERRRQGRGGS